MAVFLTLCPEGAQSSIRSRAFPKGPGGALLPFGELCWDCVLASPGDLTPGHGFGV